MVASNTQRKIELVVTAKDDGASATMAHIAQSARKSMNDAGGVGGAGYGPAVKGRFDAEEQQIRDRMAGQIRAMHDAVKRESVNEQVQERLGFEPINQGEEQKLAYVKEFFNQRAEREGDFFHQLKASFGRGSALFEVAHLLEAGGVIAGIGIGVHLMVELAEKAKEVGRAFVDWYAGGKKLTEIAEHENEQLKVKTQQMEYQNQLAQEQVTFRREIDRGVTSANTRESLAGKHGYERQDAEADAQAAARKQAILDRRDDEIAKINEQQRQRNKEIAEDEKSGKLSGMDVKEAYGASAKTAFDAKQNVAGETGKALVEEDAAAEAEKRRMREDAQKKETDQIKAHVEETVRIRAQGSIDQARAEGRGLDAEIAQINEGARERKETIRKQAEDEAREASPANAEKIRKAAQEQIDAISRETIAARGRAAKENRRGEEDAEREGAERIIDVKTQAAEISLQMQGKTQEAQQLQRDAEHRKSLEAIKKRADDEARLHADRLPEIKKRAEEEAGAENQIYDAKNADARNREQQRTRVSAAAGFTGESHLLTGVFGSTKDAHVDPTLEPAMRTAKNTSDTLQAIKDQTTALTNALQKYQAPPVAHVTF